jgi:hypothetical protein
MTGKVPGAWFLAWLVLALVSPVQAQDLAPQGSLYEVAETASLRLLKKRGTRSATATLLGTMSSDAPICPPTLRGPCNVVVTASDDIDLESGKGPVRGTFSIVVQLGSLPDGDGPEWTVVEGSLRGIIDLSPALKKGIPLGSIAGIWDAKGAKGGPFHWFRSGTFTGVFYLPFEDLTCPTRAAYLLRPDDPEPEPECLTAVELSLGLPTVRLDLAFSD